MGSLQGRKLSYLSIEQVSVGYGPARALDKLSLDIARGELFVLLGSSGSGKTTLLRTLAGFLRPNAGRVVLDGADITHLPPHRRPVNTMFQSYALFPHMTVGDNVAFGLRRRGMSRRQAAPRVASLLDMVRLSDCAGRRPESLSGGQQQRVALARALAPEPGLLLLDEPLSALDRGLREQTRTELAALQRRLGTTFMLVTHDQEEALMLATRIGLLQHGRLAQVGTPTELFERPCSRAVAEFMGISNILPVSACTRDGALMRCDLGAVGTVTARVAERPAAFVALRPERLCLRPTQPGENSLSGVVVDHAYRGDATLHRLRLCDDVILHVAQPAGQTRIDVGEVAEIAFAPEACIPLAE